MKLKLPVDKKKDLLTVSQFSQIKNMTAETLRYYDRIGLFEPDYIDPATQYRYYSILRYEEVGTIKQLRQLGMSVEQIQEYFNNKNINKSYTMLNELYSDFKKRVRELNIMKKELCNKLKFMEEIMNHNLVGEAYVQEYPKRFVIHKDKPQQSLVEFGKDMIELENSLNEIAPILGNEREGGIIPWETAITEQVNSPCIPFIFTKKLNRKMGHVMPAGKYICACYNGYYLKAEKPAYDAILKLIREQNYKVDSDIIACVLIGPTTTDYTEEMLVELQVKVIENA
jgi:DNA-binding transcriptional MerR regulator